MYGGRALEEKREDRMNADNGGYIQVKVDTVLRYCAVLGVCIDVSEKSCDYLHAEDYISVLI